ncbi:MAG TPA: class I SAM-dependent methyltransferase [Methylibium sp.]|nr:class I SAM-dependent methyltransferase [Methylibium sp.]
MIYDAVNQAVLRRIPSGVRQVLDLGCGSGALGAALKARHGCTIVGVTASAAEAAAAWSRLDRVEVADLNDFDPAPLGAFDCIVCSHVLEHLLDPGALLRRLRGCLAPGASLLVALPNALFWRQRLEFLRGRFRYTDGGLMDSSHYRFFDWQTAEQLVRDAGYRVTERAADGGLPGSRRLGARLSAVLDRQALARFPGLFGHQFLLQARATAPAAAG